MENSNQDVLHKKCIYIDSRKDAGITSVTVTGASLVETDGTYTARYEATITVKAVLADGYTFAGWTGHAVADKTSLETTLTMSDSAATVTATTTANAYTVTFDGNATDDSIVITPPTKGVTYATSIGDLATATRTGYTLEGWYKESACTTKISSTTELNGTNFTVDHTKKETRVYAKWTEHTYTIAFNGNGSTSGAMASLTGVRYTASQNLQQTHMQRQDIHSLAGMRTVKQQLQHM